jgi:hypothetical protein
LKPNKVANLPEVAHVPLLPVTLPEALALEKKSTIMLVRLLKYVVKRSNGGLPSSYFVSLLASPHHLPLPLALLLPIPLTLHKNRLKTS